MSLPLLGAGMATDGPSAVLDLNFASLLSLTPSVGPTPSYTRASTGTYFDASGVLTTAAINGPRFDHVYNGSYWVSKGLLIEEARTNLVLWSEDQSNAVWTKNAVSISANSYLAPDGTTTADLVTEDSGNSNHRTYQSLGNITNPTVVLHVKPNGRTWINLGLYGNSTLYNSYFNLTGAGSIGTTTATSASIANVGNGWYRISACKSGINNGVFFQPQMATSDGVDSYLGDGTSGMYFWGAQVESGAFPTSYIPTTTAAVTRSADVCQITGGDFSGFYNQTEGSFAVEGDTPASGTKSLVSADNATANESTILRTLATDPLFIVTDGGVAQPSIDAGTVVSGTAFKLAAAYAVNDFAVSKDGAAVATDSIGTIPTPTQLNIGSDASGNYACGHIARLRYFNTRLTNTTLRFLSGGSGAFQPDDISGLQFWVDAADSATLYTDSTLTTLAVSDGDVVGGWEDKSGNTRNALQTDGTKKPLLKLAIQNGRNVVRTDGSNDLLDLAYDTNGLAGFTLIYVVKKQSGVNYGGITNYPNTVGFSINGNATAWNFGGRTQTGGATFYSATATADPTLAHVFSGTYGTSINAYTDGVIGTPAGPVSPAGTLNCGTAWMIGPLTTIPGSHTATNYCEILMYNSELSGTNRQLVEAYLKTKWGTP